MCCRRSPKCSSFRDQVAQLESCGFQSCCDDRGLVDLHEEALNPVLDSLGDKTKRERECQDINDNIKDHELKAIRLSAHKNIKIERKTAQERPRVEGLAGQKSPPWQSPGRRQSHTIPPGRPRCQWRSRSKGKSMFSRMGANVPDGSTTNRT